MSQESAVCCQKNSEAARLALYMDVRHTSSCLLRCLPEMRQYLVRLLVSMSETKSRSLQQAPRCIFERGVPFARLSVAQALKLASRIPCSRQKNAEDRQFYLHLTTKGRMLILATRAAG